MKVCCDNGKSVGELSDLEKLGCNHDHCTGYVEIMSKPDTTLHDRNYAEDWKAWIKFHLGTVKYESKEQAMRGVMKEAHGLINPDWVLEEWN